MAIVTEITAPDLARQGKRNFKTSAPIFFALHPNLPAVQLHNLPRDAQAQSCAGLIIAHPEERLENLGKRLIGNPRAVVADLEDGELAFPLFYYPILGETPHK